MSILTGLEIQRLVRKTAYQAGIGRLALTARAIRIDPFDPANLGPNSYDVHLGPTLLHYVPWEEFDKQTPEILDLTVRPRMIHPGHFYIGHTMERVGCHGLVPFIDGRSSVGRRSVSIHCTAGRGDNGFGSPVHDPDGGVWTLEITCVVPVTVRAGERIGQVSFHTVEGAETFYAGRYLGSAGPVASRDVPE